MKRRNSDSVIVRFNTISEALAGDVLHLLARVGIIAFVRKDSTSHSGYSTTNSTAYTVHFSGSGVHSFNERIGFLLHKQTKLRTLIEGYKPKTREKEMDIFFDRITSIQKMGIKETWDIQVRGKHKSKKNNSFCVNEFLTHNSGAIEQDADWVLLLYRADYYRDAKDDCDSKAEVIISKARDGATGIVEMVFLPELTSFETLSRCEESLVSIS